MGISTVPVGWEDVQDELECVYILGECESWHHCGAPRKAASPYCPKHHALCHVAHGSEAEADRLREVEAIAKSGRPARPYRAVDTLGAMERRGSITASMRQAGEDFRARFATAQLDPLRAPDWARLRVGGSSGFRAGDEPGLRIEGARNAVWRAILAAGGLGSPAGSCLWHVVGWERSLKEWALEQGWNGRRVSQEAASGILIAALGALEAHFGMTPDCDMSIS
jgi:hypothetical protein